LSTEFEQTQSRKLSNSSNDFPQFAFFEDDDIEWKGNLADVAETSLPEKVTSTQLMQALKKMAVEEDGLLNRKLQMTTEDQMLSTRKRQMTTKEQMLSTRKQQMATEERMLSNCKQQMMVED
jgi:hypothetical protein